MTAESPRPSEVRLNRYLAMAGVASRRTAAKLIKNGLVTVNGQIVKEPGILVRPDKDVVTYRGKVLKPEKPVYILLNKPKNTLCTVRDPQGRKTVLDLLEGAPPVRLYPVGRLDRNTTGILLLTNDGDLAQKLLHPSSKIARTYRVVSVKPFTEVVVESLLRGVILPEGIARADEAYLEDPYTLIVTVHIGWKHVVRRMVEKLGYRVKSLDRIAFGPIRRKGVPRGKWRFLTPAEVGWLRMAVGQIPPDRLPKRPQPLPPPPQKDRQPAPSTSRALSSPKETGQSPQKAPFRQPPTGSKKPSPPAKNSPSPSEVAHRGKPSSESHAHPHSRHPGRSQKT